MTGHRRDILTFRNNNFLLFKMSSFDPNLIAYYSKLCLSKEKYYSKLHVPRLFSFVSLNIHTLGVSLTSQSSGLAVPDASTHLVKATSDVLDLIEVGLKNRAVGATALNERSSRSHRYCCNI